jgi:hypothetical protein
MATTAELNGLGARAELRVWYLDRLRPRLAYAVTAGIVEPGAVEELDCELAELLELHRRSISGVSPIGSSPRGRR